VNAYAGAVVFPGLDERDDGSLVPVVRADLPGARRPVTMDASAARQMARQVTVDDADLAERLDLHADIAEMMQRAIDAQDLLDSLGDDLAGEHGVDYAIEAGFASYAGTTAVLEQDVVEVLRHDAIVQVALHVAPAPDGGGGVDDARGTRWAGRRQRLQATAMLLSFAYISARKAAIRLMG